MDIHTSMITIVGLVGLHMSAENSCRPTFKKAAVDPDAEKAHTLWNIGS